MSNENKPRKPRGFAAMSIEQRRACASKGGKSVKIEDRAFFKNRKLASAAGRKGGSHRPAKT